MTLAQRIPGRLPVSALVLALAGLAGFAVPAAAAAAASAPIPVLLGLSAAHYRTHDQLVFSFAGALPRRWRARYISRLPSGPQPAAAGNARLLVTFSRATGKEGQGTAAYGPIRRTYSLPGLIQVVTVEDHRKLISFEVGVARREPYRLSPLSHDRVALEVRTPYQTVQIRDFFVHPRGVLGMAAVQAADRPVASKARLSSALQRMFAGPTMAEQARGLRFVADGATGTGRVTVRHGVARVHLAGGCNSGGSPVSIASEIVPTLRQFHWVRWVKIYDPAGRTAQPRGDSDSIPACLQASEAQIWTARISSPAFAGLAILIGPGFLLGLVLSALSLVRGLATRTVLVTPAAYRAERIKAHPAATGQFEPDSAWPFYALRQARTDLGRVEAERRAGYRRLWKWPFPPIVWVLLLPVTVAVIVCLLVAGLTTLLLAALFTLVTYVGAGISAVVFAATVVVLRGSERLWHRLVRAQASCPHCYHVMDRPAYRCPGCSKLHRDLRPGRLGLVARRCECGTLLPTMVLRAAWRLPAVCQRCLRPLRVGSGTLRDIRIPVFGDTSAGKTRFLYAGLDSLVDMTGRAGIPLGFPDDESENQAKVALDLIRSGQNTVKTSSVLPTALTCRVGKGAGGSLVHLFDTAGELFRDAETQDTLGFLDHGQGLIYVLDPFSIGSVRDRMAGQNAPVFRLAHAAAGDPEIAYGEVVSRLRDSGVTADRQRLAIVVSKADLLGVGGLELPEDSSAITDWLMAMGLHNLVLAARRDFAEVHFFAVASLAAADAGRSHDPGAPLRWLLACCGLRLPGTPDAASTPRIPGSRSRRGSQADGDQNTFTKAQL